MLPLLAVAAGGVLAINAVENGPGIVGAARTFAEGVAPKANAASPLPPSANAIASPQGQVAAQAMAKPAPVCAQSPAELAKEAGLSPAELQVIQSLSSRRGELDQREQGLSTELALIQSAEIKVDAKIATMNALKADMQGLLGQLDQKQEAEVDRLVKVFEGMKPQDAAARFVLLTDDVRLPIASKMKEQKLSAIIANMAPADAKHLTEALAARYVAQAAAARAALNPPAAPAPAQRGKPLRLRRPSRRPPRPPTPAAAARAVTGRGDGGPAGAQARGPPQAQARPPAGDVGGGRHAAREEAAACGRGRRSRSGRRSPQPGAAAPAASGTKSAAASPSAAKSAAAAPAPKPAASPPAQPATKSASSTPAAAPPAKTG